MPEHLTGVLALIVAVGVGCQWLAWRLRVPAIVLLTLGGLLTGPVLGWIQPSRDLDGLLGPFIKLSVAFILFEGGLSLRLHELREAASGVRRLVSAGVALSFLFGSAAAHYIGGLSWPVALVLGAITVVTGPTVIMPLLRHARLRRRPASYLKWEGIVNDPVGALLAVVVFELFVQVDIQASSWGLLSRVGIGLLAALGLGLGVGFLLGSVFRRGGVPEFLKGPVALACALAVYVLANRLQDEAGLVASTVLGIVLGNMRLPSIDELRRFKEYVAVLMVSGVFVLLTADLNPAILLALDWHSVTLLATLILVVRPASILLATLGSGMVWQERTLLAWVAPRGIVAAAVAGVFGPGLASHGYAGASVLLPLVLALILITVTVHGFSIGWLARRLELSPASPHGLLIVGASRWSVPLAEVLQAAGAHVVLADRSWHRLRAARLGGVPVYYGEVLSELSEQRLELSELAYVLAATDNDAYNSLVCTHFAGELGRSNVLQLPLQDQDETDARGLPRTRRGMIALPRELLFEDLLERYYRGWTFQRTRLSESFDYGDFGHRKPQQSIVFLVVSEQGVLQFNSPERRLRPVPGDQVIWLGPRPERTEPPHKPGEKPSAESPPQAQP